MTERWFDDAAGPVVRPYAMTRGRTRAATGVPLDLIALVMAEEGAAAAVGGSSCDEAPTDAEEQLHREHSLVPEHLEIVRMCGADPQSVAEVAAGLDLPVGVVRVLICDLLDAELVRVTRPVPPAELPDESVLREVIDGLRAL